MTNESAYVSEDGRAIFSSHQGSPPGSITVQGIAYRLTEGGVCDTCRFTVVRIHGELVHTDPDAPDDHAPTLAQEEGR